MSRILLIDDDEQVNTVARSALEMAGHDVVACDGADEEVIFAVEEPDVLLVDLVLPGRCGLDLLHALRELFPTAVRILATGMADFTLLESALAAGASSMLCKPYRLSDLVELVRIASELAQALKAARDEDVPPTEPVIITRNGEQPVRPEDIARMVRFARRSGAADDTVWRRVPVIAYELMKNARDHGAAKSLNGIYRAELRDVGEHFELEVHDTGPGFDWWKVLARLRTGMDKPRASGLQLVSALAQELRFENGGRVARAWIPKTPSQIQEGQL